MEVTPIAGGLWRWTAPHPEWTPEKDKPGGWGRMVGSVYYEPAAAGAKALTLVDPLAPPAGSEEARKFWAALDRDVERARLPVVIFTTVGYHKRGAAEIQRRYADKHGAEIAAHADAVSHLGFAPTWLFGAQSAPRTGVEAHPIEGLDVGETALFIREHRALVIGDA